MKVTSINSFASVGNVNNSVSLAQRSCFKSAKDNFEFGSSKFITQSARPFKNNIDVVFSDIDGTISKCNDKMSQSVIDSVNKIHNEGGVFIPVSARTYQEMLAIVEQFDFMPDYCVALNGAQVIDKNGNVVYEHAIPQECVRELVDWGMQFDVSNKQDGHFICFFDNQPYTTDDFQFWWETSLKNKKADSFYDFVDNDTKLQKAKVFKNMDETSPKFVKKVIDSFNEKSFDDLCLHGTDLETIEIFNKAATKSSAADFLLKELSSSPDRAMMIGDGENDIDLLRFIGDRGGFSVAMGNASQNVKDNCLGVTLNVDNDGFAKVVDCLF